MSTARTAGIDPPVARRGFTLIELLIVIGIIGVLMVIAAVVGNKVIGGSKARTAEDTLRVLDAVATEYEAATNAPVPAMFEHKVPQPSGTPRVFQYAILDARVDGGANFDKDKDPPVASLARFTALAKEATSAQAALNQVNSKYIRQVKISLPNEPQVDGVEIVDPWQRPIRAVHPSFDGGYGPFSTDGASAGLPNGREGPRNVVEVRGGSKIDVKYRRSFRPYTDPATSSNFVGDADEGMCANKRIYFYSVGADGNPGTRGDNVYSARPAFPQETAKFQQ